ncbi:hypothetical protein MKW94_026619 [Papaver nudicaule]|uniref:Lipase n=1 Tax=Papaver nudicaule TaxID=74823 RepID=A0AA41SAN9_PAPNU|nr:hypothetical protein [Papaver nudicaule]
MGLIQYCLLFLVVFYHGAYGLRSSGIISRGRGLLASAPGAAPEAAPGPALATPATMVAGGLCESIITKVGYKCQEYTVKTKDGYVLTLQRVNSPEGDVKTKQPAFLQHGLFMDGASWFLNTPDQSLGYILADSGYDVWVANTRGTRYSRGHESLDASSPTFWDWSWDEMVQYDLPAFLGFVNKQTGKKINYIGHSLGTLMALTSFSLGPNSPCQVLDKLRAVALLSPVAYLNHMGSQMSVYASKTFMGEWGSSFIAEFNVKDERVVNYIASLCSAPGMNCFDMTSSFTGVNCCLNATIFDLFIRKEPQSTSMKNCLHLAQTVRQGSVTKYDYVTANVQKYGQPTPPPYPLSNIPKDLPIFMTYGANDFLADPADVQQLVDEMKHDEDKLEVQKVDTYGHLDFILATNANDVVFKQMLAFIKRQP